MIVVMGAPYIHKLVWFYIRKLLFKDEILVIDCANRFDPFFISKISLMEGKNPYEVLDRIIIARAFTPFQLLKLIEKIPNFKNYPFVCLGINYLFEDENISTSYSWQVFKKVVNSIKSLKNLTILTAHKINSKRNFLPYIERKSRVFIEEKNIIKPKGVKGEVLWEGQLHLLAQ